ncbi:MAG TPA: FAD-binding oxidoreductase [Solirubrobacteraceae bacterium]|nr:FAD-binding oxidoreductase [Solirubrobacteraceae bacterium]
MNIRRRKHWGWGFEDQQPDPADVRRTAATLAAHLGPVLGNAPLAEIESPVPLEAVRLAPVRVAAPADLADICSGDAHARASHALGKSYTDVVCGFRGRFAHAPDLVARPRDEADLERLLEWCSAARVAAIPYGGGTSVVGGVTPDVDPAYDGAVSIDLARLDRVLELDPVSRAARIQAGASGPELERQLAGHGFTLRHFPQSFELSTLGGWIATRAAGHFATVLTHIEDFVESTRAITPAGAWESRRLPGSGAGVSPDRMLAGSEGALGVITEAWVRVQPRPSHRASAGVRFERFLAGVEAVRAISQSGLNPANCRLIDAREARTTLAGDGSCALLVLGFESSDHPVEEAMSRALEICDEHGGALASRRSSGPDEPGSGGRAAAGAGSPGAGGLDGGAGGADAGADAVASWRSAFLGAPYLRDVLIAMGVLSETFETAITWERFPAFHERVTAAVQEAIESVAEPAARGAGLLSCRFTHVYPDGPAPYFTVLAPARRGEEVEQWAAIKRAASDAVIAEGGTITHHHAVGRDHRPWYDRQRPEPFAQALRHAKAAVDPSGIMNPGVLIDPLGFVDE